MTAAIDFSPCDYKPSEQECTDLMRNSSIDWNTPLFPTRGNKRFDLQHMSRITHVGWCQMHYLKVMCAEFGIEKSTKASYRSAQRQFKDFLSRLPLESMFSPLHRNDGGMLIDPPWTPSQAETVLLDWVLHEAGPRGNGW